VEEGTEGGSEEARLIGRFLEGYDSKQTRRAYRNDLTGFFGEEVTGEEVREVTTAGVRRYLREEAGKYGFETVRRRASSLKAFFEWLEEEGVAEENLLGEAPGPAALARQAQNHDEQSHDGEETAVPHDADPAAGSTDGEDHEVEDPGERTASRRTETDPEREPSEEGMPEEGSREEDPSREDPTREDPESADPRREGPSWETPREEDASGGQGASRESGALGAGSLGKEWEPKNWEPEEPRRPAEARGPGRDLEEGAPEDGESDGRDTEDNGFEGERPEDGGLGDDGHEEGSESGESESGGPGEDEGGLDAADPDGDPADIPMTLLFSGIRTGEGLVPEGGMPSAEELPPEGTFPEGFLEVPSWAEASLEVQIGTSIRFTGEAFEEGMGIRLRSVPGAIVHGLSLLADAERFPEGAIEKPYYRITDPSAEWMVTVWRTGKEGQFGGEGHPGGEAADEGDFALLDFALPMASGLAARLTFAKPLMDAKRRMEEEGKAPALGSDAARVLWLLYGRGWPLTGSLYDLLEAAIGLPFGRKGPETGRGPTKRFEPAGAEETREEVALEVATLLAKGLGLSKRDKVEIARTTW
jgi:hypothetical protein